MDGLCFLQYWKNVKLKRAIGVILEPADRHTGERRLLYIYTGTCRTSKVIFGESSHTHQCRFVSPVKMGRRSNRGQLSLRSDFWKRTVNRGLARKPNGRIGNKLRSRHDLPNLGCVLYVGGNMDKYPLAEWYKGVDMARDVARKGRKSVTSLSKNPLFAYPTFCVKKYNLACLRKN